MTPSGNNKNPEALFSEAMTHIAEGKLDKAAELLEKAARTASGDFKGKILNQLGILALRSGDAGRAAGHFKAAAAEGFSNPVLQVNLAVAQLGLGQLKEALENLEAVTRAEPGLGEAWFHLGQAYLPAGDHQRALKAFETFLKASPDNPDGLLEAGFTKQMLGDQKGAEAFYEKAKAANPRLYVSLYEAAKKALDNGRPNQAKKLLARAGKVMPNDPIPHHMAAILYQDMAEKDLAEAFLKKSIEITATPQSYGQLAGLYEKANQLNDAWATAKLGLNLFPGDVYLNLVLARVERRAKKFDQAKERLLALEGKTGDPKLESQIGFQLGWLYDREENTDMALRCYLKAKGLAAKAAEGEEADKGVSFAYIEKMRNLDLKKLPSFPWSPGSDEPREVAFLVGFPRSGTTLLNQILDAHPNLIALEEIPSLPVPAGFVEEAEGGYPAGLVGLSEETVRAMRGAYFDQVRNYTKFSANDILIDKLPLNLVHLPLVWTMFPDARIILALRHPFGSVLSNFMHNFKLNNAMANMFSLDDITRYYAAVMGLWQHYRDNMVFPFHPIKYENVVTDIQREAKGICAFLGVEWSKDMLDFSRHAQKKGLINTPSYHQVTQPLYSESLERWRRYEQHLAPYRDRLLPFCKTFGYKAGV